MLLVSQKKRSRRKVRGSRLAQISDRILILSSLKLTVTPVWGFFFFLNWHRSGRPKRTLDMNVIRLSRCERSSRTKAARPRPHWRGAPGTAAGEPWRGPSVVWMGPDLDLTEVQRVLEPTSPHAACSAAHVFSGWHVKQHSARDVALQCQQRCHFALFAWYVAQTIRLNSAGPSWMTWPTRKKTLFSLPAKKKKKNSYDLWPLNKQQLSHGFIQIHKIR